ncbi:UvrD-helicase domain-containing protein [Senegalia massiliensis]|uniref:UvrD-helicase domain-containing protein n=1 Tax=Senegalia massiliensis TaxID=1720316 RepID=UPI0013EF2560|nr:UvrD-helicase domain-containing protein [Senegalia massiliensis]
MSFLDGLNDEQREAVKTTEGPLLVLAGAGSGKTRVLTHRIAYILEQKDIFPDNILAITFTNKAAKEMKERIQRLVDIRVEDMWVGTFHSMCVRMLRRDIDKIDYNRNFVIFDGSDQNTVIKDTIKELNVNEKMYEPKKMIHFISSLKDKLIDPDTYINDNYSDFRERQKGEIYRLYQEKLQKNNALDFDDLIGKTIELFRNNPDILKFYQKKFKYILVDEYQDTNRAQYELVKLLGNAHKNVCVVGDDDQCVLPDMQIKTIDGYSEMNSLEDQSTIISAGGWGKVLQGKFDKKKENYYKGPIIEIKTKKGKMIKTTPNHMMFGKLNIEENPNKKIYIDFFGSKENNNEGYYNHVVQFNNKPTYIEEYDEALTYSKKIISLEDDIEIIKRARLTKDTTFNYMPASHIRPSMSIPIYEDGEIVDDIVEEVNVLDYEGYVYDISVPNLRQYISNDIVVHNSIYGWRGADIRNILDFEEDYPNAKTIKLEQNYRSTKNILDAANKVIDNNMGRKGKNLWTSQNEGTNIGLYNGDNEHDEAKFIASKIKEIKNTDHKNYSDFAILYRTNAQSRVLEESLVKSNIPYKIVGGLKFYDRKEIKDIIAFLRLIQNPVDNISLKRIINVPKRGIGKRTVEKIEQLSIEKGESIYSVILDIDEMASLSHRAKSKVKDFVSIINKFIAMKEILSVKDLIENVIESTGYIKELQKEDTLEAQSRIENIEEFISVAIDFENTSEENTLEEFLANISLLSDIDRLDEDDDFVTLMTLHSAKGLEYDIVFLTGMEEGIFPISRAMVSEDDLEEERRLCYVGITRAKEHLFITYTTLRTIYGKTNYNSISRFIDEIPDSLIDNINDKAKKKAKISQQKNNKYFTGYTHENTGIKRKNDPNINIGDKVKHKTLGLGTVVGMKGSGDKKEATIAFNEKGIKKLLISLAPIEKV